MAKYVKSQGIKKSRMSFSYGTRNIQLFWQSLAVLKLDLPFQGLAV